MLSSRAVHPSRCGGDVLRLLRDTRRSRSSTPMSMPAAHDPAVRPDLTLSIVSHGHGEHIGELLRDFDRLLDPAAKARCEFLLTINIPEDEQYITHGRGLPMHIHRNPTKLGFGANHNAAFHRATGRHFVVVNPDIRLNRFDLDAFTAGFADTTVGAIAPRVVDSNGLLQDSIRRFPSVPRLAWRFLTRDWSSEYGPSDTNRRVDWAAGMFLVVRREAWQAVNGFDERYFMYFEDVDLCRRMGVKGWSVLYVPAIEVVHDARRATHRDPVHFRWHMRSALRFFTGY